MLPSAQQVKSAIAILLCSLPVFFQYVFSQQLKPDLVPLADANRNWVYGWYLDQSTQPGNILLRLSTTVANFGSGPLEMWGGATNGDEQDVYQRIYNADGSFQDNLAGAFIYHPSHGHIHFEGFARYTLKEVTSGGGVGNEIAAGEKVSFCLLNVSHVNPTMTNNAIIAHGRGGSSCGSMQGISVGYADVYGSSLPDQWIDVTYVPSGTYWLEVDADPDNRVIEEDETNNIVRIQIQYTRPPGLPPLNQPPTAVASANSYSGTAPHTVTFSAINSTDPDGSLVSFDWDYGDGNTGYGITVTHTFTQAGYYPVVLTVTDNSGNSDSDTLYVDIYSGSGCPSIDFNTYTISSFATQDGGTHQIQDGGSTLFIQDNAWKSINLPYSVTANTILEFEFKSTEQGEIHEIGFANTNDIPPSSQRFIGYGTQITTRDFTYTGNGVYQHFVIPIGNDFTGAMTQMYFTADNDANQTYGNSWFRNVKLYEGSCPLEQTISFDPIPDKLTTDVPFDLTATASSGLPVSYSIVSGPASVSGNTVTLTGSPGTVLVRASQSGDSDYLPAPEVDQSFNVNAPPPQGDCFIEENGAVIMEAENYFASAPGSGGISSGWQSFNDATASGGTALRAEPNTGVNTGLNTYGPRLDYKVNFTTTGTYRVYVRSAAATGQDDSYHIGLDGTALTTTSGYGMYHLGSWDWADDANGGIPVEIEVNNPGEHIFNLWMREDGVEVDKIILKKSPISPTGMGSAESSKGDCQSAPPPGTQCFVESGGQVVVEAENYSALEFGSGNAQNSNWVSYPDANASGGIALRAEPNTGVNTGLNQHGPRLDYDIEFSTPGNYSVFVRAAAPTGQDDSWHIGLDGVAVTNISGYGMYHLGSWAWADEANGGLKVEVNVTTPGKHTLNLWMREDGVEIDKIVLNLSANEPAGTGPVESQSGNCTQPPAGPQCFAEVGGEVIVEAEHFSAMQNGSGNASGNIWQLFTSTDASGGEALRAEPNTGVNTGLNTNGPRLDYDIEFTTTGIYRAYVRSASQSGVDDSYHLGINGVPVTNLSGYGMDRVGSWGWVDDANGGTPVEINITTPGKHTLNLWMREDGVEVDKIVLSANLSNPSGLGPAESTTGDCPTDNLQARQLQSSTDLYMNLEQYPNPFDDQFVLMVNARNIETIDIRVSNALGQQVEYLANQLPNQPLRIGRNWPSGIYTISVKANSLFQTIKVIKR